nr:MAG TPA: holin [Caudoviricetes sp.]
MFDLPYFRNEKARLEKWRAGRLELKRNLEGHIRIKIVERKGGVYMLELIKSFMPVQVERVWGTITGAVGVVSSYLFGAWSAALEALIVAMVIDYVSGVLAAYANPNLALNSQRGFRGICKKIMILLLVCLAHFMDSATGQTIVCTAVIWFFLGNEGLSIVENAAKMGLPVPGKLKAALEQLATEKKDKDREV